MAQIRIKEICSIAMTEEQGLSVRSAMAPFVDVDEPVVLDFAGISLFATMFFNASIGYYVLKKGVEYCIQNIRMSNISPLGKETYEHSLSNAKEIRENIKTYGSSVVDGTKVVETNIEES